jgi:hypothetical protein
VIALPKFAFGLAESNCDARFPKAHPPFERRHVDSARRAEKMDVIRHNDIAANEPSRCLHPRIHDRFVYGGRGKDRLSLRRAARDEDYDRTVVLLERSKVYRVPTAICFSEGRAAARPTLLHRSRRFISRRCRSTSLRAWISRVHALSRLVISTASSRAAAAWKPETFGARPVAAHSMNAASSRFNGSPGSISTASRFNPSGVR